MNREDLLAQRAAIIDPGAWSLEPPPGYFGIQPRGTSREDTLVNWVADNAPRRNTSLALATKIMDAELELGVITSTFVWGESAFPIKFMDGGVEREIVWNPGDMSVGIGSGYEIPEDVCSFEDLQDIIHEYCFNCMTHDKYCLECSGTDDHQLDCKIGAALKDK